MGLKFDNYNLGFKILSIALEEEVKIEFIKHNLPFLYIHNKEIRLFPENIVLSEKESHIRTFSEYNNYDVVELWGNGIVIRRYNDKSNDNYFFITGACNSNCVMCPSSDYSRKNSDNNGIDYLKEIARHIPADTPHLTITGGEPFLIGEKIYPFIKDLKEKFINTEFLFLTNGRVFAIDKHVQQLKESIPAVSILAIPIHGSCDEIHDKITRAKNSFKQTKFGIKKLLKEKISIEIRIVVSRLNVFDFDNIADLIISEFQGIEYVSIIAMEMTGNARINKDLVWLPYRESFACIEDSVRKLIQNGVNVKLYNFPLCTINSSFWTICEKSISDNKVKYAEVCGSCRFKTSCGGVFAGTYMLEKDELKAIL